MIFQTAFAHRTWATAGPLWQLIRRKPRSPKSSINETTPRAKSAFHESVGLTVLEDRMMITVHLFYTDESPYSLNVDDDEGGFRSSAARPGGRSRQKGCRNSAIVWWLRCRIAEGGAP